VKAPTAVQLALDVQRLWSLASLEETVRGRSLQSSTLAEILTTPGLALQRFDELFAGCTHYLHASFDEALALASERVAAAYRHKTRGSWLDRMSAEMRATFDAYDEDAPFSRAFIVAVPSPVPDMQLDLWELPPGKAENPCRHRLGRAELLLVLGGRPTLCTADGRRELHDRAAAVVLPKSGEKELLNCTRERVRLLALSSDGGASPMV
jgi:hypothetical protein